MCAMLEYCLIIEPRTYEAGNLTNVTTISPISQRFRILFLVQFCVIFSSERDHDCLVGGSGLVSYAHELQHHSHISGPSEFRAEAEQRALLDTTQA